MHALRGCHTHVQVLRRTMHPPCLQIPQHPRSCPHWIVLPLVVGLQGEVPQLLDGVEKGLAGAQVLRAAGDEDAVHSLTGQAGDVARDGMGEGYDPNGARPFVSPTHPPHPPMVRCCGRTHATQREHHA